MSVYLHGVGHFHPPNEITNRFLEELDIGTTDAWITERVGIQSRRTVMSLDYIRQTRNVDPRASVEARTMDQAVARYRSWFAADEDVPTVPIVDDNAVMFGYHYRSDGPPFEDPVRPSGLPGTRAPYRQLAYQMSTVDLIGRDFVLLGNESWRAAATRISVEAGLALRSVAAPDDDGAMLIRPDGFVAWHASADGDPVDVLGKVIAEAGLSRS